jgi:hypothetical protein
LIKTSKINRKQPRIVIERFQEDVQLCVWTTFQEYLNKTRPLRGQVSKLFISYVKPYKPITKQTFARWIKQTMTEAGVDTSHFKAHSTRAAATSKAFQKDIPLDTILAAANWSRASTFYKFYNKTIVSQKETVSLI